MLKTPPMESEAQFPPLSFSTPTAHNNNNSKEHTQLRNALLTPMSATAATPTHNTNNRHMALYTTPLMTPTKRGGDLSINSTLESSIFSTTGNDSFLSSPEMSSPATSPLQSLYGAKLLDQPMSPTLASPVMVKALPSSVACSSDEVANEISRYILDDTNHDLSFKLVKPLGHGAFATVFQCTTSQSSSSSLADESFAVKIPLGAKKSKVIFKEMFNYAIVQRYLTLNGFEKADFPILNTHGLTFMNKSQYNKLRYNETVPCLVAPMLSSTLDGVISTSVQATPQSLHISSDLWWTLAKQLVMSLIVLRDCQMVHMDFKTANILFDQEKREFKLADFTSAALLQDIENEYQAKIDNGCFFDLTMSYCAPELLNSPPAPPSYSSDLYAMGLVLLSAATGEEPYSTILTSKSTTSSMIYLTESIKKNKILDLLSSRAQRILEANTEAYTLIKMILLGRVTLDDVIAYISNI